MTLKIFQIVRDLNTKKSAAGSSENANYLSCPITFWEFLEWLSNYWLLKKDSAP
jgi:hypothetical protein